MSHSMTSAAAKAIDEAEAILIATGAGMSFESGIDDITAKGFARAFPALARKGYESMLEMISIDFRNKPVLAWGYYAYRMQWYRQVFPHLGYHLLHDIVTRQKAKTGADYFVFTSNVDNVLQRTGFDESKMYEKQGSYKFLQCIDGPECNPDIWLAEPALEPFQDDIDPLTFSIPQHLVSRIPRCPKCGKPAYHNAHANDAWISTRYEQQERRFKEWLKRNETRKLVVIEIGCGERLPFIRYPVEAIVHAHKSATLIRINPTEPDIPRELAAKGFGFGMGAADAMLVLAEQLGLPVDPERVAFIQQQVEAHRRPPRLPLTATPENAPDVDVPLKQSRSQQTRGARKCACGRDHGDEESDAAVKAFQKHMLANDAAHEYLPAPSHLTANHEQNAQVVPKVHLWKGDITKLEIDAIVNAANEACLGCFIPNHPCIDNQIHKAAGPELREECRGLNGCPTGEAKLTRGYNLPAKHVIHTVGPIVNFVRGYDSVTGEPLFEPENPEMLSRCYTACLELAKQHGIRSIAFCCVSTGIYGYRKEPAANVALSTVRAWLNEESNRDAIDRIVFDVFTVEDAAIYNQLFPLYFPSV